MKTKINIPDKKIKDQLCAAFEGGSNYWIKWVDAPQGKKRDSRVEYFHECPIYGQELVVHCSEDDKAYKLNREALENGINIMANKWPKHFADLLDETGDAITADVFLQCCLFGDIVYG